MTAILLTKSTNCSKIFTENQLKLTICEANIASNMPTADCRLSHKFSARNSDDFGKLFQLKQSSYQREITQSLLVCIVTFIRRFPILFPGKFSFFAHIFLILHRLISLENLRFHCSLSSILHPENYFNWINFFSHKYFFFKCLNT